MREVVLRYSLSTFIKSSRRRIVEARVVVVRQVLCNVRSPRSTDTGQGVE
jgi:hypothetical protein